MAITDIKTGQNKGFRIADVNLRKIKEVAEELGITENACINLAISDLWRAKIDHRMRGDERLRE